MNKRPIWVEPLFGEAKDWHGLGRFHLRGLWKVNAVALESGDSTVWLGLFQLEEKRDNVG